jgi:hypothetical protein
VLVQVTCAAQGIGIDLEREIDNGVESLAQSLSPFPTYLGWAPSEGRVEMQVCE